MGGACHPHSHSPPLPTASSVQSVEHPATAIRETGAPDLLVWETEVEVRPAALTAPCWRPEDVKHQMACPIFWPRPNGGAMLPERTFLPVNESPIRKRFSGAVGRPAERVAGYPIEARRHRTHTACWVITPCWTASS